jgi:anti-anti-sigma factor
MIEQRNGDAPSAAPAADGVGSAPVGTVSPPEFRLTIRTDGQRAVVRAVGELDLMSAGAVEHEVIALFERGFHHVVVDLRGLSFLDSTGIRALLTCHDRAQRESARFSIVLGDARTRRPLDICGVLGTLNVIDP